MTETKKNRMLAINFKLKDYELIKAKADKARLPVSSYIRNKLFSDEEVKENE